MSGGLEKKRIEKRMEDIIVKTKTNQEREVNRRLSKGKEELVK